MPTIITIVSQLKVLMEDPMISGKRDITNMIVNPRIFIKVSNNATEFITFERFNFFRM